MSAASSFCLAAYLRRIGLELTVRKPSHAVLTAIMAAQSRAIAFENIDVVLRKSISIAPEDVEEKLVASGRGGYCFEQNQLLASALQSLGFDVSPMLCRVRWNKAHDEHTTFTHVALAVKLDEGNYLADVGFAGTNSIAPVLLGTTEEPQKLPEGFFRTVRDAGYTTLQWQLKDSWRDLYMFKEEACLPIDLELSNWWSCTYPKARFTSQFFVARVVGDERHHILNNSYGTVTPVHRRLFLDRFAAYVKVSRFLEYVVEVLSVQFFIIDKSPLQ
jgi:N-hydroxyarylamine O-acetyltransferase